MYTPEFAAGPIFLTVEYALIGPDNHVLRICVVDDDLNEKQHITEDTIATGYDVNLLPWTSFSQSINMQDGDMVCMECRFIIYLII